MHSYVRPHQFVALRLPSEFTKIQKIEPDSTVFLGKFGSFPANQIIGRPFYLTFEILDDADEKDGSCLRVIPAAELHAETLIAEGEGEGDGEELDTNEDGTPMRTNRETVDDASTQKLTWEEIEALKKESGGAGREIISKLLESHQALDQKTSFSLAKYMLRKRRKYMKRFTVLPLDVSILTNHMMEDQGAARIMELRDEMIGLLGCWGNVHHGGDASLEQAIAAKPNGRYLVVDDTGGLVVAAMAERMGILYPHDGDDYEEQGSSDEPKKNEAEQAQDDEQPPTDSSTRRPARPAHMSASGNSITFLHPNKQPNLSLLKYFGYNLDNPDETHPLHKHLKTVSWLQLLDPNADPIYSEEPEIIPESELYTMKSNKRGAYHRKRNRWARVQSVVNEARAGEFDGLIVATAMDPSSVLKYAVPLLAGSAHVAVYSPSIEPLTELMDLYSTPRKTAFITRRQQLKEQKLLQSSDQNDANDNESQDSYLSELMDEFYLDPTLLLAPTLQHSRVRPWQVLPGRTHPLMSMRGGAEGYIFHGIRVIPTQQAIQAAGNPSRKKRKVVTQETPTTAVDSGSGVDVEMKS
ncbi:Gcd10p family-domain-containing protein [Aspergillus pseudotamarii]|uniref:tRNA (adenine(58)-N(1))-methyltransferase non-catalytic subunit TRM6 n=1 Tax=Aspergillus pseudotamarii TaxID=132259 RepID=A0A5N6SWB3_ASPPS|nr:Gcd10p family-domain-containing protein [Aspergillus pseudotamarii]KAE8137693.1 Gcd10p family-domain-containing protein [Aspergillus pseudotamarii]